MSLEKSRTAQASHAEALKATYDRLAAASTTPVTVGDLAEATHLRRELVWRLLRSADWWTPERSAASKREAHQRWHAGQKAAGVSAIQAARAARTPGGTRRKLTSLQVSEILQRLAQGDTIAHTAADYHVTPGTINQIANHLTWQQQPLLVRTGVLIHIRLPEGGPAAAEGLGLDAALWERLACPARLRVCRLRGHALVVEGSAEGDAPLIQHGAGASWTVRIPAHLRSQLGMPGAAYVSRASAAGQRLYLSDYPEGWQATMVSVQEAAALRQCSWQWLESLIARRKLRVFYDGCLRRRVLRQADVLVRSIPAGGVPRTDLVFSEQERKR